MAEDVSKKNWSGILNSIKGPLTFFALVLLCLQAVVLAIIYKSPSDNLIIVAMAACVIIIIPVSAVSVAVVRNKRRDEYRVLNDVNCRHFEDELINIRKVRLFLSTPMGCYETDEKYKDFLKSIMEVVSDIRHFERVENIYYINEQIPSLEAFENADLSVPEYFNEISQADYFISIIEYPSLSSVYFEAGYALGLGKKCIYFIKDELCLPYLMKHSAFAYPGKIRFYKFSSIGEITKVLRNKEAYI